MRLNRLELHNFRKFEDFQIDFDSDVTVLVGENGYGKSAVLDAAAIAIGTYLYHIPAATRRNIATSDARIVSRAVGSTIENRPQFPVRISAEGELFGRNVSWTRERKGPNGNNTTADAREVIGISQMVRQYLQDGKANPAWGKDINSHISTLPVIAYYGTGRLWNQAKRKGTKKSLRENGYSSALSPKADNDSLVKWLKKMTLQQLQKGNPIPELLAVSSTVEECLCRAANASQANVYFDVQSDSLVAETIIDGEATSLHFDQLSDGYRTTLGMVADIAYRMAELNPQLGNAAVNETPGVVLIDEVDLHLHPKWQARVLGDLRSVFPKVQFIVSTHSPSVIASVQKEKLRILGSGGQVIVPGSQTYGRDVSSIYQEVLGVTSRPTKVQELFDQTYQALDEDHNEKARELLGKLKRTVGENDPEVTGLETSLWLSEDSNDGAR